jgi:hypothetical protein
VAVRAQENALLCFLSVSGERLPVRHADPKGLACRIDVVENKIDDAAVVSTNRAAAAGLLDKDALDLLKAARDGLSYTPLATPSALTLTP